MACGAISEPSPVRNEQAWSRAAHAKRQSGFSAFLKNNTRPQPAWQEIGDFSQSASRPSTGSIRRSSGTPSDLINQIPYHSSEALDRMVDVRREGSD